MIFNDRIDAGNKLAQHLISYKNNPAVVVVALPRGGVIVAKEIASLLNAPLDIVVTRKIGLPFMPELAVGAVSQDGSYFLDKQIMKQLAVRKDELLDTIDLERKEINRRLKTYKKDMPALDVKDKIVILVDDGIATGSTVLAAIQTIKHMKPKKIILAVPVLPQAAVGLMQAQVDQLVYLQAPEYFVGISQFYHEFPQITDQEVIEALVSSR
ncbi:MAG: phosphoribosyltransferase [Candidatus Dependentiae bacterium]